MVGSVDCLPMRARDSIQNDHITLVRNLKQSVHAATAAAVTRIKIKRTKYTELQHDG
jgi:hypothetical protein